MLKHFQDTEVSGDSLECHQAHAHLQDGVKEKEESRKKNDCTAEGEKTL